MFCRSHTFSAEPQRGGRLAGGRVDRTRRCDIAHWLEIGLAWVPVSRFGAGHLSRASNVSRSDRVEVVRIEDRATALAMSRKPRSPAKNRPTATSFAAFRTPARSPTFGDLVTEVEAWKWCGRVARNEGGEGLPVELSRWSGALQGRARRTELAAAYPAAKAGQDRAVDKLTNE